MLVAYWLVGSAAFIVQKDAIVTLKRGAIASVVLVGVVPFAIPAMRLRL